MRTLLRLPDGGFDRIVRHVLPPNSLVEHAAFLHLKQTPMAEGSTAFDVIDEDLLQEHEFETQESDYLELKAETRARLIKRAHDLGASLAEIHSHPGPWPAQFSEADRQGLLETVPHMQWRLSGRPYIAIVVAPSGFDALVWGQGERQPAPLTAVLAGQELLRPTNLSLGGWS
ncbi:hypothetical protein HJG53_09400 [Sphingomonas sp. ID1715]|uniref:Mov34/MPN/PAD-1 family protein n=1 Tax=Sphingomonas sp. ID1715 TaxID=1656898 RepID=UPI0014887040|nr:Mov34/MPN/PAD-1 family protein [Sphingomonas sp. ID1715]NNM77116.1 hypothetical protein [Sphingomonas sp. ID1715]